MKQIDNNRANPSSYRYSIHHENKLNCTSKTNTSPSEDQWKFAESGK
jgi:hypothetical protein